MNPTFRRQAISGWLFILPAFLGFVIFALLPLVRGVFISFTDWSLLNTPKSVGLSNYAALLHDSVFWKSLWNTAYYVLLMVPLQTFLALLMAVLLHTLTSSALVRSVLILPYLVSGVVAGLLAVWLLHPSLGIVNHWLPLIGIPEQSFFGSSEQAMPSVVGVNLWRTLGYTSLFFFAGLQAIPRNIYEAAAIDGAGEVSQFFRVTVPLLRPITAFVVVTGLIGSFQVFDTIAVTTGGGPGDATRTILWYIYENAFNRFNMGYATALSLALFLVVAVITALQFRFLRAGSSDLA
ncbi:carbohydrate ABC transporter permease [Deinococcus sp.]|uniref:carbohydrate ABC transporter permease n=1 Tax=Deinococcus sp. TaxID=47478 RepID=UPI003CC5C5B4